METLSWYKNNPSEWLNGDISFMPWAEQGFFKAVCELYWIRGGNLSVDQIKMKYPSEECCAMLCNLIEHEIIRIKNERVLIPFLHRQIPASAKRLKANRSNGKKPKNKGSKKPVASPVANPMGERIREDKIREDKNPLTPKGENVVSFDEFWNAYPRKTNKKRAGEVWRRLSAENTRKAFEGLAKLQHNTHAQGISCMHATTYLSGERWEDEKIIKGGTMSDDIAKKPEAQRQDAQNSFMERFNKGQEART